MMSDVFYYFNEEDHQRLEDFYVKVEASRDLHQLLDYFSHYLKKFSSSTYSPHVQEVVTIVRERFAEELSLKDMSAHLYLNTVYLGQLIKRDRAYFCRTAQSSANQGSTTASLEQSVGNRRNLFSSWIYKCRLLL